ncbi:MAG: hypothetical protein KGM44_14080 [bacterium]|nr:hypothetical protein [bacterium]
MAIVVAVGSLVAMFYAVALPSATYGALSLGAVRFLTPGLAVAALLLGYGSATTLAMNLAAGGNGSLRGGSGAFGMSGLLASLLPATLCCTPVIPLMLAAIGVSAPVIFRTSGIFQAFFAIHAAAFIAGSVAVVLLSTWLAAYNLTSYCPLAPEKR